MKKASILLLMMSFYFTAPVIGSEALNELKMAIAKQRMLVIKQNGDAANLHARILREYKKLNDELLDHPQIKNSKLNDKELTSLKLKLLQEDEDLNDLRQRIVKLQRKLEEVLRLNPELKKMYTKLNSLNKVSKK